MSRGEVSHDTTPPAAARVVARDRRALARTISLLERSAPGGADVVDAVFADGGRAVVLGVTGPPGAGKSTLVDRLVTALRTSGRTVAVVAIDPSSSRSGGALLGDRVRMRGHATDTGVFVRSLSSRGRLGGLAEVARPTVHLLDAAGFDVVVVETVGVGQAEIDVARVADCVVYVGVPGVGDVVQAAKSGVLEVADLFVVNRADAPEAQRTRHELASVLDLRWGSEAPPVLMTTAITGEGVDGLLAEVDAFIARSNASGSLSRRRVEALVEEALQLVANQARLQVLGGLDGLPESVRDALAMRQQSPAQVARRLVGAWSGNIQPSASTKETA